ncbi:MAG: SH3 domain-containing protein [Clostridia bacterium]|nr:SH3 domain-containing protein [Clostridia bacterium]
MLTMSGALAQSFGAVYKTESLNLRADGSSSSAWKGAYSKGTWVEITGSKNNFYAVITPDGRRGYMSKNYINQGAQAASQIAIVANHTGRFLNFRASPSSSARVQGIFFDGVPLMVESYVGGWYQVLINDRRGYVQADFVRMTQTQGSSFVATIKTPNNTAINLRSGPGTGYGVIRQFPGDRYVMVLAKGKGWWKVNIDGRIGFMSSEFLVDGLRSAKDIASEGGGSAGGSGGYAVVNNPLPTQALNLRMFSNTSSAVMAKLYNGTRLRMDRQGTEWCAVAVESTGAYGYVMTKYIKLHQLPATPTLRVSHPQGQRVNLRSGPSFEAGVVRQLSSGTSVTMVAPGTEWSKVKVGGTMGYMVSYFLK